MNKYTILVVEDDASVRSLIITALNMQKYKVLTAGNGESAIEQTATCNPDIIMLDLGLPDIDGVDVIQRIRTWSNTPIIVISARNEDTDKIYALDAGADDYLTKPFSVEELLARVRVSLRRLNTTQAFDSANSLLVNGDLKVDFAIGCAYLCNTELQLTPIEYKLLCLLLKNVGRVLTYKYITQNVWGGCWENNMASLRVFMAMLRKKIESEPSTPKYIQTHVGIGYRMLRVEP